MTSKERVRRAFEHKSTDKIPTNMQCVEATWEKLQKHLGVDSNEKVMEHFGIDIRSMAIPPCISSEPEPFVNEDGETVYTHPLGYQYINKWNGVEYNAHVVTQPYNAIKTMEDFEAFDGWFNPDKFDYDAVAKFVKQHEDKAIRIGWPGPYQVFTLMYDAQEFYINMYEEPELIKAMLDIYCTASYEIYERMYEASDNKIDFICCCDDYGTQISTLFSPDMWDEFFADNTKRFVEQAHRHGAYYMQHSCGAIRNIIPNLIKCGIDGLEPIQKVTGMEVDKLKADFGDKLCFQGGVDTQNILPLGTPEQVYDETMRVIKALYKDGGYILCGSQDFEGDVPPENICALYQAGKDFMK